MAIVRLEALRGLEQAIVCAIPELEGKICLGQAEAGHTLGFPSLVMDPRRWTYFPDQAEEVFEPSPDAVVMNVGRHEADIEIRIGAATHHKRMELEQKIIDLFLSTPCHPGVLFATITRCEALGPWLAAWELDADEWRDERAYDQEFYSHVTVKGIIPALVTHRGVYTIEQLQLGLDVTATPDSTPAPAFGPPVEVVQVNENGTITPVS